MQGFGIGINNEGKMLYPEWDLWLSLNRCFQPST